MVKKKATADPSSKAGKKLKAAQKVEKKETKKVLKDKSTPKKGKGRSDAKKANDSDTDDDDLEGILEKMRKEWEAAHVVTDEVVEGPPTRRANATLTACPNGNHLWCIGGEFFSDDGRAHFYNDVFRYTPEKDEWRKFVSPTCPGPRSAHAVVASPGGGGKLFLFGGEFSSLHQNTFHHYRDFWCFDISTHQWDRIDTKVRPSARSGHRMAVWKHLIILFGGFYDPGIVTRYLNDLWVFDTQEYTWTLVGFKDTDSRPSYDPPRSGFSFLPCADGIVLHGGYCKEYMKGKRSVGVMLEDTWLLKISFPPEDTPRASSSRPIEASKSAGKPNALYGVTFKWERRRRPSDAYAPCIRSGCTMTLWSAKSMGIMFGGVTDEDSNEERLDSVFWNDLYGYRLTGKGKWTSFTLKKPKAKGDKNTSKKKLQQQEKKWTVQNEEYEDDQNEGDGNDAEGAETAASPDPRKLEERSQKLSKMHETEIDATGDPQLTIPLVRYNAMLAVLRNTLYIYGGIYERGSREYTLDDFYSLALDKMDRYICLKKSQIIIPDGDIESSSDEEEEDDEEDTDTESDDLDETETLVDMSVDTLEKDEAKKWGVIYPVHEVREDNLRGQDEVVGIPAVLGVLPKDTMPSAEDMQSTPLPGETLAIFYARTREYWGQKANVSGNSKGKQLRRDGFVLAEERYAAYKPTLREVEKILQEAGLDEDEMRKGAAGGPPGAGGLSRNRR